MENFRLVFTLRKLLFHYTIIVKWREKSSGDGITPPDARLSKSQIDYANGARVAIERDNRYLPIAFFNGDGETD